MNIGNPAIILHRSYRKPDGENDDRWRYAINEYVGIVLKKLEALARGEDSGAICSAGFTPEARHEISSSRSHHVKQRFGTAKVTFVNDVFDEFWTSRLIVDFSRTREGDEVPGLFSTLLASLNAVEALIASRFNRSNERLAEERMTEKVDLPEANALVIDLTDRISEQIAIIEKAVLPHTLVQKPNPGSETREPSVQCNSDDCMFADFVGFSLACPHRQGDRQLDLHLSEVKPMLPRQREDNVFDNIRPHHFIPGEGDELMRLVDAVWPVVRELNPYHSETGRFATKMIKSGSREFTISRLNRSRGLYVSSLGALPANRADGRSYPLSYLLLCPHRATWQIGRMIDRIHALGVFRLASLFDHEEIDTANNTMRGLIDRLEAGEPVDDVRDDFNRLRTMPFNGLHYRIEWARYYLSLYRSILEGTTFDRVEGYQTYEEFVLRRMGSYFEAIESTSRRFEYLYRLLSEKANERTSVSSKRLLQFAELVSIIPVAYYSHDVFVMLNERLVAWIGVLLPWTAGDWWPVFILLYMILVIHHVRDPLIRS